MKWSELTKKPLSRWNVHEGIRMVRSIFGVILIAGFICLVVLMVIRSLLLFLGQDAIYLSILLTVFILKIFFSFSLTIGFCGQHDGGS